MTIGLCLVVVAVRNDGLNGLNPIFHHKDVRNIPPQGRASGCPCLINLFFRTRILKHTATTCQNQNGSRSFRSEYLIVNTWNCKFAHAHFVQLAVVMHNCNTSLLKELSQNVEMENTISTTCNCFWIESEIRLFADDCVCYREINNEEDTLKLQRDIDRLGSWARKWGMRFQPVKCNMMQLTNKRQ